MNSSSYDWIIVENLSLRAIIGIFDFERDRRQEVRISFRIATDISSASETDDIEQALDYKRVTKQVIELVETSSFFLVETLVERIATQILQEPRAILVEVKLEKPGALRHANSVGVQITRSAERLSS